MIHANENPELYGYTLTAVILAAQCGCTPFYYLAGRAYTRYMTEQDEKKAALIIAAQEATSVDESNEIDQEENNSAKLSINDDDK